MRPSERILPPIPHSTTRPGLTASALIAAVAVLAAGCEIYFGPEHQAQPPDVTGDPFPPGTCGSGSGPVMDFPPLPLEIGNTVSAEAPPPAISGGTLAIAPDDVTVVAADSDRDQVYIASLETNALVATVTMRPHDEPGRVVIDDTGHAYVALRRGGGVSVIDLAQGVESARHEVCAAPRGLAYEAQSGLLYVACHGGEFVAMNPTTGQIITRRILAEGLRDVVLADGNIYVARFREADVLILDGEGQEIGRMEPPVLDTEVFDLSTGQLVDAHFEPGAAWRTVAGDQEGVVMLHQRGRSDTIAVSPGGYGGDPCSGGIVHTAITPLAPGQSPLATSAFNSLVLPVDMTLVNGGASAVVIAAGNVPGGSPFFEPSLPVVRVDVNRPHQPFECDPGQGFNLFSGQPIAVASTSADAVVVQTREPAGLSVFLAGTTSTAAEIALSVDTVADTGHTVFHMNTGFGISCASCHLEGGDDGRVWEFECIGPRRTQSLDIGGLSGTEPFHWDGDMNDLTTLMDNVFVGRMGGGIPSPSQLDAMGSWLDTLQPPPRSPALDPQAVERGQQLFFSAEVGCAACHAGPKFTDNKSYDVGTDGTFQVPSLVGVGDRAPYIHTGCAETLTDRFTTSCGGGDRHGVTSQLAASQIADLVAFLKTL